MKLMKYAVLILVVTILVFNSNAATKQTWKGDKKSPGEVITLEVPYTVTVGKVDDHSFMDLSGVIGGKSNKYLILPGDHTIQVQYYDLFETGSDDHESIRSEWITLKISGKPGAFLKLTHKDVDDLDDARKFAENPAFHIKVLNPGNELKSDLETKQPAEVKPGKKLDKIEPENTRPPKVEQLKGNLDLMKNWWKEASEEDRTAFLQWIVAEK